MTRARAGPQPTADDEPADARDARDAAADTTTPSKRLRSAKEQAPASAKKQRSSQAADTASTASDPSAASASASAPAGSSAAADAVVHPTNTTLPTAMAFARAPAGSLKLVSWNVAGFNAAVKKGMMRYIEAEDADIVCIQETKLSSQPASDTARSKLYPHQYWSVCTAKKGYSGTAVWSKVKPISVRYTIGDKDLDDEGRFIILEFEEWFLVASYIVNAGQQLERLALKHDHYAKLQAFLKGLQDTKPVVWTGDINVAHNEVDLARPKTNTKTAGFTPQEREDFGRVLTELDMLDTFRDRHPDATGRYTYFSYRFACRSKNLGWRLDYFVVSHALKDRILDADIRSEVYGASDHVPIVLVMQTAKKDQSSRVHALTRHK
ncbi:Endonuclease/exonuclease/phosphatase [Entophlyctis helioformis]|nr:Endonuclease/exonuclease/phosphatase [Entophlyctis helioformis]